MLNSSREKQISQGVLNDTRNGKEQPWKEKKLANSEYADLLALLQYLKVKRVSNCADVLRFAVTEQGHLKLKQTWFCKSRLCPMCAWRRSKIHAVNISKIVEEAQKRHKSGRWLFLTLTTKNTYTAEELSNEIKNYSYAFSKMLSRKALKDNVLGFFRGIEVTVNKKDGSYNQHMHVLLFVREKYFRKGNYLKQVEWVELWQKAMKLAYSPSVNIKTVQAQDKQKRFKAVLEIAKYPVKSADYIARGHEENLKALDDLEKALTRKRLIAYGGLLKEIQKEFNLADIEDSKSDLIVTGEEVEKEQETEKMIVASWDRYEKNYFLKE